MAYRLEEGEEVAAGIRRIAREQVDGALASLGEPGADPSAAVHDARKRLKKTRAVLRLVRRQIGEDVFQRENTAYRDAGKLLAPARETAVAVETVEGLRERFPDTLASAAVEDLAATLRDRKERTLVRTLGPEGPRDRALRRIDAARGRIDEWPLDGDGFEVVGPGLEKVYKRARRRMEDAYSDPAADRFHEWRKRVKYLWYHLRILHRIWPAAMSVAADEAHEVADFLGDANDLHDFRERLAEGSDLPLPAPLRSTLDGIASRGQEALWTAARPLGQRLLAEGRARFVARTQAYWRSAPIRSPRDPWS
ncbi:MAG: CHAD domain-containing protein [Gemmatimonadota bacterium]|nr:CHAD domain-containing protein [Gemmatimonadota bacterium]